MTGLSELRKKENLTQQQVADRLQVSRTTVAMWETGANNPPVKYLIALAHILNCTVEQLLKEA